MNNRHYTDRELELLILREDRGESAHGDGHIDACALCGDRHRFLREFYSQLRREMLDATPPRVSALADAIQAGHRLVLPPFRPRRDAPVPTPGGGLLLHAAESVTDTEPALRYTSVATFALASTGILARVVRDRETGLYRVFVLSENPDHRRYVLVGVGGPRGETPLAPTDHQGLATFRLETDPDWTMMFVVVITPTATLPLPDGLPGSGILSCGSVSIGIHAHAAGFEISLLSPTIEKIGHALVVLAGGTCVLLDVRQGAVVLEPSVARQATEIRFFL